MRKYESARLKSITAFSSSLKNIFQFWQKSAIFKYNQNGSRLQGIYKCSSYLHTKEQVKTNLPLISGLPREINHISYQLQKCIFSRTMQSLERNMQQKLRSTLQMLKIFRDKKLINFNIYPSCLTHCKMQNQITVS